MLVSINDRSLVHSELGDKEWITMLSEMMLFCVRI